MIRRRKTLNLNSRKASAKLISGTADRGGVTAPYYHLITRASESNQIADPFLKEALSLTFDGKSVQFVEPIYPLSDLLKVYYESNTLQQCVEAYVTNIESYGYTLEYIGNEGEESNESAQSEKNRLAAFFSGVSASNSLREIRERLRRDKEILGFCALEIIRDGTKANNIIRMEHIPASTLRMTRKFGDPVVTRFPVKDPKDPTRFITATALQTFRLYAQKGANNKQVFFKEFGDPRPVVSSTGDINPAASSAELATEILFMNIYAPGTPYGLPRWIGQLPSILGSRESEVVNLKFFRENAIPAMAVLVSGGALTEDSFRKIESYINAVRGPDAMNRVLVLEAAADDTVGSTDHSLPAPKIEMKPMISERQQEGLFQDYDQKNQQKVRSAFRLPPIYVGRAEDYTRASAFASMMTAESQIFAPERSLFDDIINNKILANFGIRYWRYKSSGPSVADPDSLAKVIDALGKQGALTPNSIIKISNELLAINIQSVMEDWGDVPFSILTEYIKKGFTIKGLDGFLNAPEQVDPDPGSNELDDQNDRPTTVNPSDGSIN